ncbi:MAG: hypothetical protein OSA84_09600 [Akkermansiaceae bacterium]|nr:hypothetical protein [Akkermansiaceae bacterium]
MKTTTMTLIAGLAIATTAYAGDDYSSKSAKEVIPPPAPSCLWSWFAGGSAGYVSGDWDEEIYTLHVGTERKCDGDNYSHAFFLEVGYTEKDAAGDEDREGSSVSGDNSQGHLNIHAEIIPITLNYKYECALTGNLNWYVGAGTGIALVDLDTSLGGWDDTTFYAHVFAGIVYNVSESFELSLGVNYLIMNDPNLTGSSPTDKAVSVDGDIQVKVGASINF